MLIETTPPPEYLELFTFFFEVEVEFFCFFVFFDAVANFSLSLFTFPPFFPFFSLLSRCLFLREGERETQGTFSLHRLSAGSRREFLAETYRIERQRGRRRKAVARLKKKKSAAKLNPSPSPSLHSPWPLSSCSCRSLAFGST